MRYRVYIMSGKSIKYWTTRWQTSDISHWNNVYSIKNTNAARLLTLLSEYAGFPTNGLSNIAYRCIGAGAYNFFTARWNRHHGDPVKKMIRDYLSYHYTQETIGTFSYKEKKIYEPFDNVETILFFLKESIANTNLSSDGDLARILAVVKTQTNADYKSIELPNIEGDKKRAIKIAKNSDLFNALDLYEKINKIQKFKIEYDLEKLSDKQLSKGNIIYIFINEIKKGYFEEYKSLSEIKENLNKCSILEKIIKWAKPSTNLDNILELIEQTIKNDDEYSNDQVSLCS